jgi:hypothetical protein
MLQFCEENAQTLADDSTALVDVFVDRYNSGIFDSKQNLQYFVMPRKFNVTNRKRNFRHIITHRDYRQMRSGEPTRTCRFVQFLTSNKLKILFPDVERAKLVHKV